MTSFYAAFNGPEGETMNNANGQQNSTRNRSGSMDLIGSYTAGNGGNNMNTLNNPIPGMQMNMPGVGDLNSCTSNGHQMSNQLNSWNNGNTDGNTSQNNFTSNNKLGNNARAGGNNGMVAGQKPNWGGNGNQALSAQQQQANTQRSIRNGENRELQARLRMLDLNGLQQEVRELLHTISTKQAQLQAIFAVCLPYSQLLLEVLDKVDSCFFEVCQDAQGATALQTLIGETQLGVQCKLRIAGCFNCDRVLTLSQCAHGSHVIRKLLSSWLPEEASFLFPLMRANLNAIACSKYGTVVLQRLVDALVAEDMIEALLIEMIGHAATLAQDPFGNYLLQYVMSSKHLYKFQDRDVFIQAVLNALQEEVSLETLCCQKFASNVIEHALCTAGDRVRELFYEEGCTYDFLNRVIRDRFGNYIVQRVLELSNNSNNSTFNGHQNSSGLSQAFHQNMTMSMMGQQSGGHNSSSNQLLAAAGQLAGFSANQMYNASNQQQSTYNSCNQLPMQLPSNCSSNTTNHSNPMAGSGQSPGSATQQAGGNMPNCAPGFQLPSAMQSPLGGNAGGMANHHGGNSGTSCQQQTQTVGTLGASFSGGTFQYPSNFGSTTTGTSSPLDNAGSSSGVGCNNTNSQSTYQMSLPSTSSNTTSLSSNTTSVSGNGAAGNQMSGCAAGANAMGGATGAAGQTFGEPVSAKVWRNVALILTQDFTIPVRPKLLRKFFPHLQQQLNANSNANGTSTNGTMGNKFEQCGSMSSMGGNNCMTSAAVGFGSAAAATATPIYN
ncbi:unnamed protein product [Amoebophrya sp. A120]|nr:unnamed protein product [Amoebophrya sp. A120]|eukprot:GSA120T00019230001.1